MSGDVDAPVAETSAAHQFVSALDFLLTSHDLETLIEFASHFSSLVSFMLLPGAPSYY